MALILGDRVKETTTVIGTGTATLLGATTGFQSFSVVGNGNTTYYCIADQGGPNWEVGIGTYTSAGTTLARTTVLASSNAGGLVSFTSGVKDIFVTYPSEKGVWLDASNNAIGLGTPAAFVGTNITGTASGLTAGNVTTNANLSGAVSSIGNSTSLGSFTSAQLALAISDETGTGKAVFATNPTLTSPTYAGTLTGSTDILNIGSGQLYKDASGNVGIGTSSPASKLDIGSGNLNFSGTAQRITGDFTNSTFANRVAFQTSVANSGTTISAIPNGTAASSNFIAHSTNDLANASTCLVGTNGVEVFLQSSLRGTGTYLPMTFYTSGSEKVRIDTSGNVGIGTTNPLALLDINGSTGWVGGTTGNVANIKGANATTSQGGNLRVLSSSTIGIDLGGSLALGGQYTSGFYLDFAQIAGRKENATDGSATGYLAFATRGTGNTTERMRIDSSGNVGIGVTPSASTTFPALEIGGGNCIFGSANSFVDYTYNAYYNGAYRYKTTGYASYYEQASGSHRWFNAPAGTAGNAIGFTQPMTLDSSGNLLVGTTIGSYKITCNGQPGANGYTAWTNYSDQRLKENITDFKGGLKEVLNLSPKSFNYNKLSGYDEDTRARTVSGFIAQELELVCPEMVGTTEINGVEYLDTNTSNLNLLLIKAIQELKAIIDTQQEQINCLLGK